MHDTGGAAQGNKAGPLVSDVLSAGGTETAGTAQVQKSAAPPPAVGISAAHLAGGVQTAMLAAPPTQAADAAGPDGLKGLTGRQLRMARRVAQKHGLTVVSDQDAVTQLRARGIDPFQRSSILELVAPLPTAAGDAQVHLPQTMPPQVPKPAPSAQLRENLPSTERIPLAERRAAEIRAVQRDIASRRRRLTLLLFTRLAFFVLLPTILAGWYFYQIATPMYATKSEFIIQQADGQGGSGMGGLFGGTSMGTQQDSMTVQSYLTSRAALLRLDRDHGFKAHFGQPDIDPIQRLPEDASNEAAYKLYQSHVKISYDPTEGILKMEVIAADPASSQRFSEALIGYAEEQVDQLTQRLRGDQMAGAQSSYEAAEVRRAEALQALLRIQQDVQQIDPAGETAARTQQISALEIERQRLQRALQTRLAASRPNTAQVNALRTEIAGIEEMVSQMRRDMTQATIGGTSLAAKNIELRVAEENYTFQTTQVQQALQQMESAQIEANRQVRYLSLGVEPVAPDEASYPRAFENTVLALLILSGIYLMISLTASILREQVSS